MAKSHGERRKTRHKLRKGVRERGLSPVSRAIQEFEVSQSVHIIIDPSVHRGMPHPKYHGKTAKVVGQRGAAYILEVTDQGTTKEVLARPEHLRPQES